MTNVPSKSLLSVRGMEGRLRGRLKARIYLTCCQYFEVRGRPEVLRGRAAAQLRGNVGCDADSRYNTELFFKLNRKIGKYLTLPSIHWTSIRRDCNRFFPKL